MTHRTFAKWALAATLMLSACGGEPAQNTPEITIRDKAALDAVIDGIIDSGGLPVLYVHLEDRRGNIIYRHSAVNTDLVPVSTVDGGTWFRIWSMSKIVTISAALDMVEDGLFGIDDPVVKHIPEFEQLRVAVSPVGRSLTELSATPYSQPETKEAVNAFDCPFDTEAVATEMTIRDLINHTAGFYYQTTNIPCLDAPLASAGLPALEDGEALIEQLAELPLIQQPGSGYYYGTNTTVLGLVMERIARKPLAEIVKERITGPLGIEKMRYDLPAGAGLLPRYTGRGGALRVVGSDMLDIFGGEVPQYEHGTRLHLGGEGMIASADGYADFLRMLLGYGRSGGVRILETATVEELTSPHTQTDSEWGYNGYNLWVNSGKLGNGEQGVGGLWIGGGYEGTHFWIDQERRFVGVIMSQIHEPPAAGANANDVIREAVYDQILEDR